MYDRGGRAGKQRGAWPGERESRRRALPSPLCGRRFVFCVLLSVRGAEGSSSSSSMMNFRVGSKAKTKGERG
jgi:hypothetical protein